MEFINEFLRSQPNGGTENYRLTGTVATCVMMVVGISYLIFTGQRLIKSSCIATISTRITARYTGRSETEI